MKSGKKKKQNRSNGKNGKGVASIFGKNLTENGIGNAQEKKRNSSNGAERSADVSSEKSLLHLDLKTTNLTCLRADSMTSWEQKTLGNVSRNQRAIKKVPLGTSCEKSRKIIFIIYREK